MHTRSFVAESVRAARSIIEAVEQRNTTRMRVVKVILARQREWFEHGPQHLKPMPMVEVAEMLGIHVATVSRAVSEKWAQSPRGLVPLRGFFSLGTENTARRRRVMERRESNGERSGGRRK